MFEDLKENELCPYCKWGQMKIRRSRFGEFLACNDFPKCAFKKDIKKPDSEYETRKNGKYID